MFRETLFEPGRDYGRKAAALPVALLVHATIVVLLVMVPLVQTPRLPEVDLTAVILAPPPPAPPPAPPKGTGSGTRAGKRIKAIESARPLTQGILMVPTDIPAGITAESLLGAGVEWGVEGGVPVGDEEPWPGVFPSWISEAVIPVDDAPLRAVGEITPPKLIRQFAPEYPEIARRARIEGVVVLEATTDVGGRVVNVTVLRSIPLLDQAAVDAVRRWLYNPMVINGRPRPVTFTVTVRFVLR